MTAAQQRLLTLTASKDDSDSDFELPSSLKKKERLSASYSSVLNKEFSPRVTTLYEKFKPTTSATSSSACEKFSIKESPNKSVAFPSRPTPNCRTSYSHSDVLANTVPETQFMDTDELAEMDFFEEDCDKLAADSGIFLRMQDKAGNSTPAGDCKSESHLVLSPLNRTCRDSLTWAQNTQKRLEKSVSLADRDVTQLQLELLRHMCGLLQSPHTTSWANSLPPQERSLLQKLLDINISLKRKKVRDSCPLLGSVSFQSPVSQSKDLADARSSAQFTSGFNNHSSSPSTISAVKKSSTSYGKNSFSDESKMLIGFSPQSTEKVNNSRFIGRTPPISETQVIEIDDTQVPEALFRKSSPSAIEDDESCPAMLSKTGVSKAALSSVFDSQGQFKGTFRDDGKSSEFTGHNFPHSKDMMDFFHQVFGLKYFRQNQLQAINACMLGKDCFVLMPTGGGKSLCYQLPALLSNGVTFVISPLRSLIQDQVQRLCSLGVPATHLCNDIGGYSESSVYADLHKREPGVKLVYITPEKLSCSSKLQSALDSLFQRKLIARFVIDEAHCISQWGHDFRPDYKKLSNLREKYTGVSIMALTATATPRVRTDILHQLHMGDPKWFLQSFNRSNLKYQVLPKKGKKITAEVAEFIRTRFPRVSGIVYCLSRNECDSVAADLKAAGLTAVSYHAGLADNRRVTVQDDWLNDKFQVICATIAFGMGIDKPNVRYVIHYSLPKSIEGYYQESGRAGRDGEISHCLLYYSYGDVQRLRHMIEKGTEDFSSRKTHVDNLYKIVAYCENKTDCRRAQQLGYFGEVFKSDRCRENLKTACDNCLSKGAFKDLDVTNEAKAIVQTVVRLVGYATRRSRNITLVMLADLFKGSKNQRIISLDLVKDPLHGKGAAFNRNDVNRLMHNLVIDGYLHEDIVITAEEHAFTYIRPGRKDKVDGLLGAKVKIHLAIASGSKLATEAQSPSCNGESSIVRELEAKCYDELLTECKNLGLEHHINYTNVMNLNALKQMSKDFPVSEAEMLKIPHVTKVNFDKYGRRLLDITERFAAEKVVLVSEAEDKNAERLIVDDDWEPQEESPYFESTASTNKRKGTWGSKKGYKRRKPNYQTKNKYKAQSNTGKRTRTTAPKRGGAKTSNSNGGNKFVNKAVATPGVLPAPKPMPKAPGRSFLPAPMVYQRNGLSFTK